VFTGIAAVINYELNNLIYSSAAPASFIALSSLTAMLPFLVSAVLSFSVAALISRAIKTEAQKDKETQTKQEAEIEEIYK
jgi:large-conductance mechanosensitive channel